MIPLAKASEAASDSSRAHFLSEITLRLKKVAIMRGVSVIVRSSNAASRLPAALAHLKAQTPTFVPWEVLLVDNASTDDTVKVALSRWGEGPVPLRIVP